MPNAPGPLLRLYLSGGGSGAKEGAVSFEIVCLANVLCKEKSPSLEKDV
jgi:hypothetical protein